MSDEDALLEQEEEEVEVETSTIREIRQHAKRLEKDLAKARKELEELRAYRAAAEAERRAAQVKAAFQSVGLNERWADLYVKVHPDAEPTPESVRAFAEEYSLPIPATKQEEQQQPTPPAATEPFAPTATPAATPTGRAPMTWREFAEMHRQDPARAVREAQERGLVDPGEVGVLG